MSYKQPTTRFFFFLNCFLMVSLGKQQERSGSQQEQLEKAKERWPRQG